MPFTDHRAMCLGAIFDHPDIVGAGKSQDAVHVAGPACQMHGQDADRARGDERGNRLRRDVLAVRINVGEHRNAAGQEHTAGRCNEAAWGHDDFVARLNVENSQRGVQCYRTIGHCDCVSSAGVVAILRFEGKDVRAGPGIHLAGPQDAGNGIDLFVSVDWPTAHILSPQTT
jgi:hypothetical protein